jgi:hypothetical protein
VEQLCAGFTVVKGRLRASTLYHEWTLHGFGPFWTVPYPKHAFSHYLNLVWAPSRKNPVILQWAFRTFILFRPDTQRERISVRIEVEQIQPDKSPEQQKIPMIDCPSVFNMMKEGVLTLPFSSSILIVETPEEIFTDKLRALYERPYLKGRDFYDLWFLHSLLGARTNLNRLDRKLQSYIRPFRPARRTTFFLKKDARKELRETFETDLRRFLPFPVYKILESSDFATIFQSLEEVLNPLIKDGLEDLLNEYD